MSYREQARRLAKLEAEAEARVRPWFLSASEAEIRNLSDEELEELCSYTPPDEAAALEAMSDEDLERLAADRMPDAEWERHVQEARERLGLGPVI